MREDFDIFKIEVFSFLSLAVFFLKGSVHGQFDI